MRRDLELHELGLLTLRSMPHATVVTLLQDARRELPLLLPLPLPLRLPVPVPLPLPLTRLQALDTLPAERDTEAG